MSPILFYFLSSSFFFFFVVFRLLGCRYRQACVVDRPRFAAVFTVGREARAPVSSGNPPVYILIATNERPKRKRGRLVCLNSVGCYPAKPSDCQGSDKH